MVQVNNTPITVRVKFCKVGRLQYISHLDLVSTMMKIIVRSGLPLWYTEGFNPKPKLSFAAPLSIGTESVCEFMDIRLTERVDEGKVLSMLNSNLTDELRATEAYYPEMKLTALKWLGYTIAIDSTGVGADTAEECDRIFSADRIVIFKKTKSGQAEVDIKPLIKSISSLYIDGELRIECVLSADSAGFLNPEYIVRLLRDRLGLLSSEDLLSEGYSITRHSAYLEDMKEFK